jgi:peptidoglycan/xylan/chitin deacetylase (PgdA/CDA1 family)
VRAPDARPLERLDPAEARIALTFDDGPDAEWTPRVLDVLDSTRTKATFFVSGQAAQRAPELLRRALLAGHALGNHGYSHAHPWLMGAARARAEVRDGAAAIADAAGSVPRLYRPAFGRLRAAMSDEARLQGQRVVLWSLSAIDWGPLGRDDAVAARLRAVRAGDIVLMHDARNRSNRPEATLAALPALLADLRRRALEPVTLATL